MKCLKTCVLFAGIAILTAVLQGCGQDTSEAVSVDGNTTVNTRAPGLRGNSSNSSAEVNTTTTAKDLNQMRADDFPFYQMGTLPGLESDRSVLSKDDYYRNLKHLDIEQLYRSIAQLLTDSKAYWPADGPQDGDTPSYAGLFGRLAWHCAGTFRLVNGTNATGGCEGARQRYWPENEWRDNVNLDKARGLLGEVKSHFSMNVSWADLITFAGTVGIRASGGPAKKFCFGRVDDSDGKQSVELGVQGTNACRGDARCTSDAECKTYFRWTEQNETDNVRCNLSQADGRLQASHSVGLIYVYPEGPELKNTHPAYNPTWVHNRYPNLSALEVRDTFKIRMGWNDRETVALIGGGHTLGRAHGNCKLQGTKWASKPYNGEGPHFEAVPGSLRGPTDGTCGAGSGAGLGRNTVSSGFEGAWTRTPSRWNYDFFAAMLDEEWEPSKSPFGNDQWRPKNRSSPHANTQRLTSDLGIISDDVYKAVAMEYAMDHDKFDSDFADAWYKLVHRSADHPHENDLEKDAGVCTEFEFLN